jgi:hypothetical protein
MPDMIPGDVPQGHPGLTQRVLDAVAKAKLGWHESREISDEDGPHEHHWQPILWVCRGCGAFDPED